MPEPIRGLFGWLGAMCLAFCALPQVIHTVSTNDASGLSMMFIIMWWVGEFSLLLYIQPYRSLQLLVNYYLNLICVTILLYYKFIEVLGVN